MIEHIGFYGHSGCAYRSKDSFIDILAEKLNSKVVNIGVRQGSEERILFELKKTKKLDVAIIFHSEPGYLFLPNSDRDIDISGINQKRIENLIPETDWDSNFSQKYSPKFLEEFKCRQDFTSLMDNIRDHLYHPDVMLNRFYGNLIQIDQYLLAKKIPAVHILEKSNAIPQWFAFQSGVTDYTVAPLYQIFKAKQPFFVNCITKEGNLEVVKKLEVLINAACSR